MMLTLNSIVRGLVSTLVFTLLTVALGQTTFFAEATEVHVWFNTNPNHMNEVLRYLDPKLPDGIAVKGTYAPWRGPETTASVTRGEYDLIVAIHMDILIFEGLLTSLDTQVVRDDLVIKELDFLMDSMRTEGRLYDFPVSIYPMVVMYNQDIFDEKNVPYPDPDWTWNDFREKAALLTEESDTGTLYGAEARLGLWEAMVWSTGYGLGNGPESLLNESFSLWTEMMFVDQTIGLHEWDAKSGWPNYFGHERAAMQVNDLQTAFYQANQAVRGSAINWGIAPLPTFPGHTPVTPNDRLLSVAIPDASPHKDAAWEVLKLLVEPEAVEPWLSSGYIPAAMTGQVWDRYEQMKTGSEPRMPTGLESWMSRPLFLAGRGNLEAELKAKEDFYTRATRLVNGEILPSDVLDSL